MEKSIVAAITDLKEAMLTKLEDALSIPMWSSISIPRQQTQAPVPSMAQSPSPLSRPQPPPPAAASPSSLCRDSPRCLPIQEGRNHLPSTEIEASNLRPPELTVKLHPNLLLESRLHTLALKLAMESYFGTKIMARCTVMGSTSFMHGIAYCRIK